MLTSVYQKSPIVKLVIRTESCIAVFNADAVVAVAVVAVAAVAVAVVVAVAVASLLPETATLRTAACEIRATCTPAISQAAKVPLSDPV